ncbi:MAG: hypothetical protein IJ848_03165 [Alphaproteobacteria bacterium]|nr:hypothetical protein [Alphaproteobacteria bacterium]
MNHLKSCVVLITTCVLFSGCEYLEKHVYLKNVAFEVDPDANNGDAFVCNIVVPYYDDLNQILKSMDAKTYFTQLEDMKKKYKDSIEIFSYDIIPGKNKPSKRIEPRSRFKAKGAYIFAKYSSPGRYAETIGLYPKLLVQLKRDRMELNYDFRLKDWKK